VPEHLRAAVLQQMAVLAADSVSKHYGGVTALDDVSLSVAAGEVCGLIGPNGAGKTTLFDVLSGVQRPSTGHVLMGGSTVTTRSPTWRARHGLRRTFQRQQPFPWLSVGDNLVVALDWHGRGGGFAADLLAPRWRRRLESKRRRTAREALDLFGLGHLAPTPAGNLTIGQLRMMEMARALVDNPGVVLLDEPTSGLSSPETAALGKVMLDVRQATGCAFVLVEHDVPFVMSHCDRVVAMDAGRILAAGPPDEVRANPEVATAYLGSVH
jgi:branched-chain amino acid transport system ATP-binding protein